MGTINYGTNKYITMGLKPFDFEDTKKALEESCEEGITFSDVYEQMELETQESRENVEEVLSGVNFDYFHLSIEPGYYEGFYIKIESDFEGNLDDENDKTKAREETEKLKDTLKALMDADGFICVVSPGWCMTYYDRDESLRRIDEAANEILEDIEKEPLCIEMA